MVPVEQPQLGRGVAVHTALQEASAASPEALSVGVQPGGERGPAWGVCRGEEQRHSWKTTASARAAWDPRRHWTKAWAQSCHKQLGPDKDRQARVGGLQPLGLGLSHTLGLCLIFPGKRGVFPGKQRHRVG